MGWDYIWGAVAPIGPIAHEYGALVEWYYQENWKTQRNTCVNAPLSIMYLQGLTWE
jgi:hypothetical protein